MITTTTTKESESKFKSNHDQKLAYVLHENISVTMLNENLTSIKLIEATSSLFMSCIKKVKLFSKDIKANEIINEINK